MKKTFDKCLNFFHTFSLLGSLPRRSFYIVFFGTVEQNVLIRIVSFLFFCYLFPTSLLHNEPQKTAY